MEIGRSSNPTLNQKIFDSGAFSFTGTEVMTLQGTVNKIFIMLLLVLLGAIYTWNLFFNAASPAAGAVAVQGWIMGGAIGGFVFAMITSFKKSWAPYTAPVYALLEGVFLGAVSAFFETMFQGIVIQAVALTFGTLFALLFCYKSGIIKPTQKFKLMIFAATGGICLFYLITFILSLFHMNMAMFYGSGNLSIGISLVVVVIAALNLVLDFDFIEQGVNANAPKYMEWYSAFGLMVTLVWLYIEFLQLLAKLANRR